MRACAILGILWFVWSLDAAAQGGFGSSNYEYIELRSVGTMEGNYQDGRFLRRMSDGVDMVFVAANPEDSLTIRAKTVQFRYEDEAAGSPSRIILEGDVVIVNSRNTIRSDYADIDFDSGDAVFTGNPHMDTEEVKNLRAKVININLNTGDYEMSSVRVDKLYLNRTGGGSRQNPYLLSESDMLDWRGFLERLKEEGARPEPSPGKHLVALLDEQVRSVLLEVNVDALLRDPSAILKQLNKALVLEQFYDEAAWGAVSLSADSATILEGDRSGLSEHERTALNRRLLRDAYPRYIAPLSASSAALERSSRAADTTGD